MSVDLAPRPRARTGEADYEVGSFAPTQIGFDEATARTEASRCFRCDAVYSCPTVEVRAGRGRPHQRPAGAIPTPPEPTNPSPLSTGGEQ